MTDLLYLAGVVSATSVCAHKRLRAASPASARHDDRPTVPNQAQWRFSQHTDVLLLLVCVVNATSVCAYRHLRGSIPRQRET